MIRDIKIDDMDILIKKLNDLPNHFIFRGHADSSWSLASTLERTLGDEWNTTADQAEDFYLNIFKSKYHIYKQNEHTPQSKLSWLSVMQHYGAPTRLIDFTESPYTALYFAMEAYEPKNKKDLSIYSIDYKSVMNSSIEHISKINKTFKKTQMELLGCQDEVFDSIVDQFSYDVVWITEPVEINARMDRQSGTFLISGNRKSKIEDLLSSPLYDNCHIEKIDINSKLYKNIYALLRKMNINAKSIYGDLSGLAKSIKMEMQVYSS